MEHRLMAPPTAANLLPNRDVTVSPQYQHCIEVCLQCFEACEQAILHYGSQEEVDPTLIRLLNDAAEITEVSATFMLRGSIFHIRTCAVCAEVTKVCGEACDEIASKKSDDLLKTCASTLKDCSDICYRMAHHH